MCGFVEWDFYRACYYHGVYVLLFESQLKINLELSYGVVRMSVITIHWVLPTAS